MILRSTNVEIIAQRREEFRRSGRETIMSERQHEYQRGDTERADARGVLEQLRLARHSCHGCLRFVPLPFGVYETEAKEQRRKPVQDITWDYRNGCGVDLMWGLDDVIPF